ncbi:MAG: Rrf2 family transcriptional regulator [Gemmatimonadales bacterium]|nr:Rrf2 family transcriptional regulator [Gemmatimonadales bacterium]
MLQITKQTEYAIRGLQELSRRNGAEPVQLRLIAAKCEVSEAFLAKIFQMLGQAGIVKSHRGVKGGFNLGRPASEISMRDIVEVSEGGINLNQCLRGDQACKQAADCRVAPLWAKAQNALTDTLECTSLADVL